MSPRTGEPFDEACPIVGDVDVHLQYCGPLPSTGGKKACIKEKHGIRQAISTQLIALAQTEQRLMPEVLMTAAATHRGRVLVPQDPKFAKQMEGLHVELAGYTYVPVVSMRRKLCCRLNIQLLERGQAMGAIVRHGDLDNRLKTLLDALRVPQNANEVPPLPARLPVTRSDGTTIGPTILCLLEDDALVTELEITTGRWLIPATAADKDHVFLNITVTLKPRDGSTDWMGQP